MPITLKFAGNMSAVQCSSLEDAKALARARVGDDVYFYQNADRILVWRSQAAFEADPDCKDVVARIW